MNTDYCVVLCSCPDSSTAEKIAKKMAELKLVACTNVVPHLTSIYPWKGEMVQGCEALMVMKTHVSKLAALEKEIVAVHPYEFPEFIALPIMYGNAKYLEWAGSILSK